jgi:hypothetical protein
LTYGYALFGEEADFHLRGRDILEPYGFVKVTAGLRIISALEVRK